MTAFLDALSFTDYRASIAHADFADWITVAAYCIAAALALRASGTARLRREARERLFWQVIGVSMVVCAINELFDFQTVLTVVGKAWAQAGGWYERRRTYQAEFIAGLGVLTVLAGMAMVWFVRRTHAMVRLALFGMVFIAAFVMVRAASFHHVDTLLGMGSPRFNWGSIQEMIGIGIVACAALFYARRPKRRATASKRR